MRKEELERRCAEMKARMLAQRAKPVLEEPPKVEVRKPATGRKRVLDAPASDAPKDEVAALKAQGKRLEAENRKLRQQLDAIGSRSVVVAPPSRSGDDEVREQRHNYFKYSNARRW